MSSSINIDPSSLTNTGKHYNHLANQSKVANANSYRQWIESHTPATIHNANRARRHLARLGVKAFQLHDHRQVKGPRNSYNFYYMERIRTGDYRGLSIPESAKLVGTEWKALPAGQKKVCRPRFRAASGADAL